MFGSICTLLEEMIDRGLNSNILEEAKGAYKEMRTFEFLFILLLLHKVLGICDILCQALQMESRDILNALNFVSTTKMLLQNLRENGWNAFFKNVVSFCERHDIDMLNMCACYMEGRRRQKDNITFEQHYHFNMFNVVIDFQLMELNNRFID